MARTRSGALAWLGLLIACTGTRTGNPNDPGTERDLPKGAELIRSALARDQAPEISADERAQFGADSREFALELYREAAAEPGNLIFSPYSISVALAMTYAGAEGDTEREMADALRFTLPEPELHAAFNATALELATRAEPIDFEGEPHDGLELSVLNAAFAQQDTPFEQPFLDVLARQYDAGIYTLDFSAEPEASRASINDWVADRTEQRVEELLPEGSIVPLVRLVLANAIHFQANWAVPFKPEDTTQGVFRALAGDVPAELMHATQQGQYAAGDGYQAFELRYVPTSVRMLFILPAEERFDAIEAGLDAAFVDGVLGQLSMHAVAMTVPRFRFGSVLELRTALSALGMPGAFTDGNADFSGMTKTEALHISEVYHQGFIALDEHGTEAAAATAVVLPGRGVLTPVQVVLDRPFLFVIYDEPTGQILFLGRLVDPG